MIRSGMSEEEMRERGEGEEGSEEGSAEGRLGVNIPNRKVREHGT